MLRNRSRAVTSKQQALMSENTSQSSQTQIHTKPMTSFFFNSSGFRVLTTTKVSPLETDPSLISPTSILDTKAPIFSFKPICFQEPKQSKSPKFHSPGPIGLADLVSTKTPDKIENSNDFSSSTKPINKTVLFGSKLRVQIPNQEVCSLHQADQASPRSPADYGTKTRTPRYPGHGQANSPVQTKVLTGCLSVSEMEMSEDYTCVTCRGPNPKTTHIFDNCVIVESFCSLSAETVEENLNTAKMDNFLSFCYTCKKNLDQKDDIFIYRGEKAFCSGECRYQEMLIDEMEN